MLRGTPAGQFGLKAPAGEPTRRRDLAQIDVAVNVRWQDASEPEPQWRANAVAGSIKRAAPASWPSAIGPGQVANPGMRRYEMLPGGGVLAGWTQERKHRRPATGRPARLDD